MNAFKPWLMALLLVLGGCGGGGGGTSYFPPVISGSQVNSLKYGQTAVILLAGKFMRNDMVADTGTCKSPAFRSDSSADVAVLTCSVKAAGALPITVRAATGDLLYSATLTVPQPQVALVTSKGNIIVELNPQAAPITVNNFLAYVNKGFYSSTLFHRVIAGFVVQGGGYITGLVKKDGEGAAITLESNKGLSNTRGTVAMARTSDPNSATSEFFFNLVDNTFLDYQSDTSPGYAVFAKVVQGMDVVDAIAALPTGPVGVFTDVPTTDVTITLALQTQ